MMNKKIIQIESYDSDDFMDSLVEKLTQRIKEELDCCNEADTASKEWMTTKGVRLFQGQSAYFKTYEREGRSRV